MTIRYLALTYCLCRWVLSSIVVYVIQSYSVLLYVRKSTIWGSDNRSWNNLSYSRLYLCIQPFCAWRLRIWKPLCKAQGYHGLGTKASKHGLKFGLQLSGYACFFPFVIQSICAHLMDIALRDSTLSIVFLIRNGGCKTWKDSNLSIYFRYWPQNGMKGLTSVLARPR